MWAALLPADLSEGCARNRRTKCIAVSKRRIGVAELRCICEIEDLGAKDEVTCVRHWEQPLHRHVQIVLTRPTHDTDTAIAEVLIRGARSVGRLGGLREGVCVKIVVLSRHSRKQ